MTHPITPAAEPLVHEMVRTFHRLFSASSELRDHLNRLSGCEVPSEDEQILAWQASLGKDLEAARVLLRSLESSLQQGAPLRDSQVEAVNAAHALSLYRTFGDSAGERILKQPRLPTECAQAIVAQWADHVRSDGYTLRALMAYPQGWVRFRLVSRQRIQSWMPHSPEMRALYGETIYPFLFEKERSPYNRCEVFLGCREMLPEYLPLLLRDEGTTSRVFHSRGRSNSVRRLLIALIETVDHIREEWVAALLENEQDHERVRAALLRRTDIPAALRVRIRLPRPSSRV